MITQEQRDRIAAMLGEYTEAPTVEAFVQMAVTHELARYERATQELAAGAGLPVCDECGWRPRTHIGQGINLCDECRMSAGTTTDEGTR